MLSVLRIAKLFIVLLFITSTYTANAQRWEIGGLLGGSNYLGDISKEPTISQTHLCANLWGRYNLNRHFSYRFGVGYGKISGHDSLQSANKLRGLGFRSNIWEFSNIVEFHYNPFGLRHPQNKKSTVYVLSGINIFYFNPQNQYDGEWMDLQPLGTEGQDLEGGKGRYSRVSVSIPMGIGTKHMLDGNWILGFEIGYRIAFTDYLDDVSGLYPNLQELRAKNGAAAVALSDPSVTAAGFGEGRSAKNDMRGDYHLRDWYIFAGVTLSYRIANNKCYYPRKTRRFQSVD